MTCKIENYLKGEFYKKTVNCLNKKHNPQNKHSTTATQKDFGKLPNSFEKQENIKKVLHAILKNTFFFPSKYIYYKYCNDVRLSPVQISFRSKLLN